MIRGERDTGARAAAAFLLCAALGNAIAQEDEIPPPPPDRPQPALLVAHAANARLLDLERAGARWVAAGEQGVIVVSDNGSTWRQVEVPNSALLTRLRFTDERNGWAVGYDATILQTRDGGLSWELRHRDPKARALYDLQFLDAQNGLAVGGYGTMLATQDGGQTWQTRESPLAAPGLHFNRLLKLDNGLLFIAGERGMLARSADRGASWQMLKSPYVGSYFGALALGGGRVIVFGMRGNVYVSEDIAACPTRDAASYDPYTAESVAEPAAVKALGWRHLDTPTRESLFGASPLPGGGYVFVGTNGEAVTAGPELQTLKMIKLRASETLVDVLPDGQRLLGVGKRGVQNLGALP